MREETGRLEREDGISLAWRRVPGRGPGVVFLGGLRSDMTGEKASALAAWCAARGRAFLRFDYRGHGASDGRFQDGTIGRWAADAEAAVGALTQGPQVLVGSSMGGWIALLLARGGRLDVAGVVGIAAAPDFTDRLAAELPEHARTALARNGVWARPSAYGPPIPITAALLADGTAHRLLPGPIPLGTPVRLLHGQSDADVPWADSLRLAAAVVGGDVQVTLVKDGDHRLSRPADLRLLCRTVGSLLGEEA